MWDIASTECRLPLSNNGKQRLTASDNNMEEFLILNEKPRLRWRRFFSHGRRVGAVLSGMARIGTRNRLRVVREATPGVYLDGEELGEILLPRRYVPAKLRPGDEIEVFVYLDSEDRLVATTESPMGMVGEIACLEVVGVN